MIIARQSTARTVTVGPVLDATGVAVTDGVVGDFKISKNGGAPAALNGSATLTHRNTGHYSLALTASDLDTVGQAEIVIDDTVNACPVKELTVVEEAVYDALFVASATGMLPANVIQLLGTAWLTPGTAGTPDVNAKLWNGLATVELPLVPTTAGRKLDVSAGGEAGIDWANVGSPTTTVGLSGTTVKTATDVETDTQDIQTQIGVAGAGLTAADDAVLAAIAALNNLSSVQAQAAADAALVANNLDHLLKVAAVAGDVTNSSVIARLTSKSATPAFTSFDNTTDSLEAIRDRGDAAWVTGSSPPSAASIADAVWDEDLSDHDDAGSTGEALAAAGSAGDPWSTALPGSYAPGTAGYLIGTALPTTDDIVAALSGRTIVIQSPLNGTKVTLYAEAKYSSGTQRLVITNATGGGWPNGATWDGVKFVARVDGTDTAYGTGVWIVTSGAGAQVAISFTAAEMKALTDASGENGVCGVWAYKTGDVTDRFPLLADGKLRMVDVPWA